MIGRFLSLTFLLLLANQLWANSGAVPPDSSVNLVDRTSALLTIDEGRSLFYEGKVRDALVRFRQASVKDPYTWKAPFWIGQCHYVMNNYGLALKYAHESLKLGKDDVDNELYELLGKSYHRTGSLDSALMNYEIALSKMSNSRSKELRIPLRIEQVKFAQSEIASGKKSLKENLGAVNSGYDDYCPILINNGKAMYFVSRRSDTKGGNMNPDDQEFFEDTYYAVWNDQTQTWDSISNELGRVNTNGFDAITFISEDGMNGLMTVNTTALNKGKMTKGSDIFTIEMSNKGKWSTPKRINNKWINTSFFEGSATMTADGNTMYFVTDRKGEKSSTDIYVVYKNGKSWGEPEPLPFTINTTGRETTPFITADGRYLFFSSDGHPGMGGLDVYVVENMGASWGTPVNLGIMVNSVNNDTHFQYYPKLKTAVLSSFEIIGNKASMDMYKVDMSNFTFPGSK